MIASDGRSAAALALLALALDSLLLSLSLPGGGACELRAGRAEIRNKPSVSGKAHIYCDTMYSTIRTSDTATDST